MSLDIATVVGISAAFLLIAGAIILGGQPGAFVDLPAIFIVLGGTFGVTVACYSLQDTAVAARVIGQTVFRSASQPVDVARHLMQLSDAARRKGYLALQDYLPDLMQNGLLYRGIAMVVDGEDAGEVERIMQSEQQTAADRHERTVSVLRKAAEISPAMGLIGTLVGLVQMLGNLEDPSTIGPSMAVALLTTFYGAVLANLVFTPLASKLERNAVEDDLLNEMYVMAAGSIARQENPRRLEMLLNTVLPPENKIVYFR
ncbi:MAG: MotA/TolQ/ExbB proton channel family protein [Pseudomonadota bacterium]